MAKTLPAEIRDWREFAPYELPPTLTGALAAFREYGYHGASVRDIAARVGVTVPALYYHHENKQAMLVALLEGAMDEVLVRARLADAAAGDRVLDRYANVIECLVLHMTHRVGIASLDAELRYLEPANRKHYAAMRKQVENLLGQIIEAGVEEGLFEAEDPQSVTRALLGMCQAVAGWYREDGPMPPAAVADRYVVIALRAVGARVRAVPRDPLTGRNAVI